MEILINEYINKLLINDYTYNLLLNEHFVTIVLFTTIFICVDRLFESLLRYRDQTTFYLMHFFFNFGITIHAFPCFIAVFTNIASLTEYSTMSGSNAVVAFQIYHCVIYYNFMRFDDWLHHILAWVISFSMFFHDAKGWGVISYLMMTGFPGLFYYGPLFMLKNKWITKKTEITIQYYVNVYLRCPAINFAIWINLCCYLIGIYEIPQQYLWFSILNIFISLWNACYFTAQTTKAYVIFKSKYS